MVLPIGGGGSWVRDRGRRGRNRAIDRSTEDLERLIDDGELRGVEPIEELPKLALIEFPEPLEERMRLRRHGDDDLATIARVGAAAKQSEIHEPVHQLTRGR